MESLAEDDVHDQQEWQEAHSFLIQMWEAITAMQLTMRQDLGISAPQHP
ncbi:hypothetical protein NKH18_09525 [Streptomyces sp. M10(2022)]